jgi:beta-phosphoglucomutase-like phosphatase (HAD superfamily)
MSQPSYQAVIFDMDGLIVDSETIYYNAYNQTLNDLGVDIPREEYFRCVGHSVEGNSVEAVKLYNLPILPEDFLESWMKRFESAIGDPKQIDLMPGCIFNTQTKNANHPQKRCVAPLRRQFYRRNLWRTFFWE